MDIDAKLDALRSLFERLEIDVRQERLGGDGGGLCQVRGRRIVFVDMDADPATRLERAIQALAALPELEDLFIPPTIREDLDRVRARA